MRLPPKISHCVYVGWHAILPTKTPIPHKFTKLVRVKIQVLGSRCYFTFCDSPQAINHDAVGLIRAKPTNVMFNNIDATVCHLDSIRGQITNRTTR
jgi:hypothetical protein